MESEGSQHGRKVSFDATHGAADAQPQSDPAPTQPPAQPRRKGGILKKRSVELSQPITQPTATQQVDSGVKWDEENLTKNDAQKAALEHAKRCEEPDTPYNVYDPAHDDVEIANIDDDLSSSSAQGHMSIPSDIEEPHTKAHVMGTDSNRKMVMDGSKAEQISQAAMNRRSEWDMTDSDEEPHHHTAEEKKQFESKRKAHYNEFMMLKKLRQLKQQKHPEGAGAGAQQSSDETDSAEDTPTIAAGASEAKKGPITANSQSPKGGLTTSTVTLKLSPKHAHVQTHSPQQSGQAGKASGSPTKH